MTEEEIEKNQPLADPSGKWTGKKFKWQIVIPIVIAIIVVGFFYYLDFRSKPKPEPRPTPDNKEVARLKPLSPSENPEREKEIVIDGTYGCASPATIEPETLKEPDSVWTIKANGESTAVSLGKYRINNAPKTVTDIMKMWFYFSSEDLSDRDDWLFELENSYVLGMKLIVNDYEREIKLGGGKYMFIELGDYPLGDLYPYDKRTAMDFEFIVELKCKNIKEGACLDNEGKKLDYLNGKKLSPQIRIFARGCQEFTHDIEIQSEFKYEN